MHLLLKFFFYPDLLDTRGGEDQPNQGTALTSKRFDKNSRQMTITTRERNPENKGGDKRLKISRDNGHCIYNGGGGDAGGVCVWPTHRV